MTWLLQSHRNRMLLVTAFMLNLHNVILCKITFEVLNFDFSIRINYSKLLIIINSNWKCVVVFYRVIHIFNEMNDINFTHAFPDIHYTRNIPYKPDKYSFQRNDRHVIYHWPALLMYFKRIMVDSINIITIQPFLSIS